MTNATHDFKEWFAEFRGLAVKTGVVDKIFGHHPEEMDWDGPWKNAIKISYYSGKTPQEALDVEVFIHEELP